ncbi:hypothetical protein B0H66DRAFT_565138 [Apodospora peruviana]|uniref:Uncharacterized protein n=1 Tax=Apodospora peruviana TaxID=516989 RepID=A0AAE0M1B1_9PEZI|nr:hypothetical protein B0H66DRAFT_565138 [Apodospora peruviana]
MKLSILPGFLSLHRLLAVLLFISFLLSSCAWAGDARKPSLHLRPRGVIRGAAGARAAAGLDDTLLRREEREQQQYAPRSPAATVAAEPAHVVRDDCQAQITPAPSLLLARQDDGQIRALSDQIQRISQSFQSVSQASQQVSQSSQQLSQSLQQATQRLSQTEAQLASIRAQKDVAEQASRSATQAANDASRRADEASASADRAIESAFSAASRSASEAMAQVTGSMAASAASALAQASQSAVIIINSAASRVQQAQADATAVRNEAQTQVQQAQGAAVSVTQAALAVVGGIVVSSLLTIVAFVLVLRYKRRKKQRRGMFSGRDGSMNGSNNNISYPALNATSSHAGRAGDYKIGDYESNYDAGSPPPSPRGYSVGQYPADVKEPLPVLERNKSTLSRKSVVGGGTRRPGMSVGYAVSTSDGASTAVGQATTTTTTTVIGGGKKGNNGVGMAGFQLRDPPKGKFSLFPSPSTASATSPISGRGSPQNQNQQLRGSKTVFPSLDTWLRGAGTNVSPFSTVNKNVVGVAQQTNGKSTPEWPMTRS